MTLSSLPGIFRRRLAFAGTALVLLLSGCATTLPPDPATAPAAPQTSTAPASTPAPKSLPSYRLPSDIPLSAIPISSTSAHGVASLEDVY